MSEQPSRKPTDSFRPARFSALFCILGACAPSLAQREDRATALREAAAAAARSPLQVAVRHKTASQTVLHLSGKDSLGGIYNSVPAPHGQLCVRAHLQVQTQASVQPVFDPRLSLLDDAGNLVLDARAATNKNMLGMIQAVDQGRNGFQFLNPVFEERNRRSVGETTVSDAQKSRFHDKLENNPLGRADTSHFDASQDPLQVPRVLALFDVCFATPDELAREAKFVVLERGAARSVAPSPAHAIWGIEDIPLNQTTQGSK